MKKGSFVEFYDDSEVAQNYEDRKEKIEKGGLLMEVFNEDSLLKNKPVWLKDLFKKVNDFCLNGIQKGVKIAYLETYTRYSFNNLMFCKVKAKLECLKIYLKLRYGELENPPKWVRDYAQISRQTWCEAVIRERDLLGNETILLDMIFDLIKQSFNRVIRHPKLSKVSVESVKKLPNFVHPTLTKVSIEIGTDGFCQLKVNIHKSQLSKTIEKLLV